MCQRCQVLEKQLSDVKNEFQKTSQKLKSEARFEFVYGHEDLAEGYERAAARIDKILMQAYGPTKAQAPYGVSPSKLRWFPSILWNQTIWDLAKAS